MVQKGCFTIINSVLNRPDFPKGCHAKHGLFKSELVIVFRMLPQSLSHKPFIWNTLLVNNRDITDKTAEFVLLLYHSFYRVFRSVSKIYHDMIQDKGSGVEVFCSVTRASQNSHIFFRNNALFWPTDLPIPQLMSLYPREQMGKTGAWYVKKCKSWDTLRDDTKIWRKFAIFTVVR